MSDEAENLDPQNGASDAPEPSADDALDEASSIADDVAAQADEGADMSDDEAAALAAAMSAISDVNKGISQATGQGDASVAASGSPFESPEFEGGANSGSKSDLDLLSDVHMNVRIELGRTRMFVEDVLRLGDGAVVELDKLAGDPVDVFVNDRKVARGEVLVLNDNFCVRINEILDLKEN
jgi:flagellar motor switch protein FliN/FliY